MEVSIPQQAYATGIGKLAPRVPTVVELMLFLLDQCMLKHDACALVVSFS